MSSIIAIACGATCGALLRWVLALWLGASNFPIPLGTLVANFLGAYLIGVAVAIFSGHIPLPETWRLFIITGFMGALTTFSTFSAEVVTMLQEGKIFWAIVTAITHLFGSLILTYAGLMTVHLYEVYH